MDPLTTAIVAAASAGVADVSKSAIADAYASLKAILVSKFGSDRRVARSLEDVEEEPSSTSSGSRLGEVLNSAGATTDPDVLSALKELRAVLRMPEDSSTGGQTAIGSQIAQADRGGHASVSVNRN